MNALQIANYARDQLDDPNLVFLSQPTLALYLQIGYDRFRALLPDEAKEIVYAPAILNNVSQIDLNNVLFGQTPIQARCQRITRVQAVDPLTGQLLAILVRSSYESLSPILSTTAPIFIAYGSIRWWLDGRILRFSSSISLKIEVWYVPDQTINWQSATVTGADVYVDDFADFHPLIALFAAQQYAAKDGAGNVRIDQNLATYKAEMVDFFAQTRSGQGSRYVQDDVNGWYGG